MLKNINPVIRMILIIIAVVLVEAGVFYLISLFRKEPFMANWLYYASAALLIVVIDLLGGLPDYKAKH